MPNKSTTLTNTKESRVQIALRRAVKSALERKNKLGQYSVIWRDSQIITEGEDAPLNNQQK